MSFDSLESLLKSDVELEGFAWEDGGRDVILRVVLPGSESRSRRTRLIACLWAERVLVRLTFAEGRGGYALSWDASFERMPDGSWSLHFDFGSTGEIQLHCADIEVSSPQ